MFARHVSMRLKPKMITEFQEILKNEVLPLLRQRAGFQDELVLVAPNGTEAVGISLWDNQENADAYQRETYPDVRTRLSKVIDGTLQIQTYQVPIATFHKLAAGGGRSPSGH